MISKKKSTIKNLKSGKNCKIIEPVNIYDSEFGKNVFIGPFVEIQCNTKIGDNTRIQSHSFICEKVTIGDNCFIGHGTMFINDTFKNGKIEKNRKKFLNTKIEDNVLIGTNSTIFPVRIKKGSVIGAGSVVTKNLIIKGVYFGNPAKLIRRLK
jgi:acetyltransferase-like isoleucine patch superfamily enzyme